MFVINLPLAAVWDSSARFLGSIGNDDKPQAVATGLVCSNRVKSFGIKSYPPMLHIADFYFGLLEYLPLIQLTRDGSVTHDVWRQDCPRDLPERRAAD